VVGRPAALVSDEGPLETCICDDALYKLTIFTFFLLLTLNPKNRGFSNFLAIFGCIGVNCYEKYGDRPRLPGYLRTETSIGSRAFHEH